jgi:hypothetical protein
MKSLSINQMASLNGGRCNKNLCYKAFMGYMSSSNPVAIAAFYAIMNSSACSSCGFGES